MSRTSLPNDLIRDYWRKVRDRLVSNHGMTVSTANSAVRQFRRRAKQAGETIYNTDSQRIAETIAHQASVPIPTLPLVPTAQEVVLARLPRWAEVALAARCARRVWPLVFREWDNDYFETAVRKAVELTENAAAQGHFDPKQIVNVEEGTTDAAHTTPPGASAHAASVVCSAVEATQTAHKARPESPNVIYPSADAIQRTGFALLAAATIQSPVRRWLRCVRRDFDRLVRLAKQHKWTDDTPVTPEVFGPMWPKNLTPEWVTESPLERK